VFIVIPDLISEVVNFFRDFHLVEIAFGIFFIEPRSNHPKLYTAIQNVLIAYGVAVSALLIYRILAGSPLKHKVKALSSATKCFGTAFLLNQLSIQNLDWISFLIGLLILLGITVTINSLSILLE